jgi:hypothetical protein
MPLGNPASTCCLSDRSGDAQRRLAQRIGCHLAVMPFQPLGIAEHLGYGLLRCEAGSQRDGRTISTISSAGFRFSEEATDDSRGSRNDGGKALGVDDVDADADHGRRQAPRELVIQQ